MSLKKTNDKYQCSMCKGVFDKGWSDEEADKEAKDRWGIDNASQNKEMAVICDDCWPKINPTL